MFGAGVAGAEVEPAEDRVDRFGPHTARAWSIVLNTPAWTHPVNTTRPERTALMLIDVVDAVNESGHGV